MFHGTGHSKEVDVFVVRESSLFTALPQFRNVIADGKKEVKRKRNANFGALEMGRRMLSPECSRILSVNSVPIRKICSLLCKLSHSEI